ncbi:MAG: hypothetical protein SNF73_02640 [Rikenellaceae bacterium]
MSANAQIVLIGDNTPHGIVNDGAFTETHAQWRQGVMPRFWSVISKDDPDAATNDATIGIHLGTLYSSNKSAVVESKLFDTDPRYQTPHEGDRLDWSIGVDLEYKSASSFSASLLFGDVERTLVDNVALKGGDMENEIFAGQYRLTQEDAAEGLPRIRLRFSTELGIKIFVDYINVSLYDEQMSQTPTLGGRESQPGVIYTLWSDDVASPDDIFTLYRAKRGDSNYAAIYEGENREFYDSDIISGVEYQYVVTRSNEVESAPSNRVVLSTKDSNAPSVPQNLTTEIFDSEVALSWDRNEEVDFKCYSVYRDGEEIASGLTRPYFEDILAPKMVENTYTICAHDYSGNVSEPSKAVSARVKIVRGAAFSDLILPMPIIGELSSDLWGAEGVIPRDPDNGIESPDWSYWGGRPTYDPHDGKYHMMIVRWREDALKGHWEWPTSTVAHAMSDGPMGPYKIQKDLAYDYKNGLGHNADIIKRPDGSFVLYSLIEWEPTLFTSQTLSGEWERLGVMDIDWQSSYPQNEATKYQYERNLTGVETEDGRVIIVTKFGATMVSDDGLLGTYHIVADGVKNNPTIPERYRNWNYEDPVMWRDDVQYHMIINAFIAKRAIYLRSGDGINWIFDPGLAYTPDFTRYENGVINHWDKLERPHVLQDEYGRATHLSLAVIDVDKALDYGSDNHNSKNIIMPLVVSRRMELLNKEPITAQSDRVSILLLAEDGFDPQKDIDLNSLRFGVDKEVNFGRGSKLIKSKAHKRGLILEFEGVGTGVTDDTFALKLLGSNLDGELVIGYSKLHR